MYPSLFVQVKDLFKWIFFFEKKGGKNLSAKIDRKTDFFFSFFIPPRGLQSVLSVKINE